jgi:arginase
MADIELIAVPFDGYGRPGNQANAAGCTDDAGLIDAFDHHHVTDHSRRVCPIRIPAAGESTSLINERALLAMTDALNRKGRRSHTSGAVPVRLRRRLFDAARHRDRACAISVGGVGLVFIDGHEGHHAAGCVRRRRGGQRRDRSVARY